MYKYIKPSSTLLFLIVLVAMPEKVHGRDDLKGAIGVRTRIGWDASFYGGGELSFQRNLKGIRALEFDLGFAGASDWNAYQLTGLHQWKLIQKGGFNFYLGAGLAFAYIDHFREGNLYVFSLDGDVGISYTFGFPIQLALDWRPGVDIFSDLEDPVSYDFGLAIRLAF